MVAISRRSNSIDFRKIFKDLLPPLVAILVFLVIWQLFSSSGLTKLPGPLSLVTDQRTRDLLLYPFYDLGGLDKGLFWQTMASLKRVAIGYLAAAVVGIGTGILVGINPILNKALDPIFQFLRTVPPLAWVPISLAALQQNEPAALFVIFITAVWPILINTTVGVQQIPQDYINVRRVLQLSNQKFFSKFCSLRRCLTFLLACELRSVWLGWQLLLLKSLCRGLWELASSSGMPTKTTTSAKLFWRCSTSVRWV